MKDVSDLLPKILKWEGGFVNDPFDRGGATNMGITLETWKTQGYDKDGDFDVDINDLKALQPEDVLVVLRRAYWNRWQADDILNQSIADILVDWIWGSGKWGIIIPQRLLGVVADGIVGNKTIMAVNFADPKQLHKTIYAAREKFLHDIVKRDSTQKRFIKGWLNRLSDFQYSPAPNIKRT
jgi:lysozyme family protein